MRAERTPLALLCAALSVAALGCEDDARFSHLEYREHSTDPVFGALLGERSIALHEGIAVAARVSAIGDDLDPMPVLRLRSLDPDVIGVERGPALGWFVFFGVAPGSTELVVSSDGRQVGRIAVTVEPQSRAPSASAADASR